VLQAEKASTYLAKVCKVSRISCKVFAKSY
jgi:hypothetical protein